MEAGVSAKLPDDWKSWKVPECMYACTVDSVGNDFSTPRKCQACHKVVCAVQDYHGYSIRAQ